MHHAVEVFAPDVAVIDPLTNLMAVGTSADVRSMLTRMIDYLKTRGVTAMFTSLTTPTQTLEHTEALISSLMDTWILMSNESVDDQRTRRLYVLKSRGMPHSDEVRPFRFSARGIELLPAVKPAARKPAPRARRAKTRKAR
jgi:circadian clock protein KaiC